MTIAAYCKMLIAHAKSKQCDELSCQMHSMVCPDGTSGSGMQVSTALAAVHFSEGVETIIAVDCYLPFSSCLFLRWLCPIAL